MMSYRVTRSKSSPIVSSVSGVESSGDHWYDDSSKVAAAVVVYMAAAGAFFWAFRS
jgi:hypothetical protein